GGWLKELNRRNQVHIRLAEAIGKQERRDDGKTVQRKTNGAEYGLGALHADILLLMGIGAEPMHDGKNCGDFFLQLIEFLGSPCRRIFNENRQIIKKLRVGSMNGGCGLPSIQREKMTHDLAILILVYRHN